MTVELTPEQVRWLGGLFRGFCEDPIYATDDEQELRERFLQLLDSEMLRGRDDQDISPRIELEGCSNKPSGHNKEKIHATLQRSEFRRRPEPLLGERQQGVHPTVRT